MTHRKSDMSAFRLTPMAAVLLGAAGSFSAQAAETTGARAPTLAPVTVTERVETSKAASPKFTAPLLDTPQTLSVIPAQVFSEQGAQNLTDVLKNTPGISFNAGENGFSTSSNNFSMRGFDTSGSIFIDGVRDSGSYTRDVFNVERVEVAKGPAADNGRGSAGGYVNLVTKTPFLENAISGTASYGFDGTDADARQRVTADFNQRIGEGSAARVNLLYRDGGVAGRAHVEQKSLGIAPSVAFGLNGPTRLVLAYQHMTQDDVPDMGVPAAFIRGMSGNVPYNPALRENDRDNFYGLLSDFDDTTSDAVTVRLEHAFSDTLRISNQTRYSDTERKALFTAPTGYDGNVTVTTQRQGYQRDNTSLSNLTNLSLTLDTGGIQHTLAAGIEFSREKSDAGRFPTNGTSGVPGTTDIANPDPRRGTPGSLIATQNSGVEIDTVAAYVYDTVQLSEQWQLTGGLRLERYEAEIRDRNADGTPRVSGGRTFDGHKTSETSLGGKIGVVYKPVEHGSLYLAYGLATLPPGSLLSNSDISREGDNGIPGALGQNHPNSDPQKSENIELGIKWDFLDQRLSTTLALYQTERSDIAMGPATTVDAEPVGYGKQTVQGIELGVTGRITEAWEVFAGVGVLDSERKHNAAVDAALSGDYAGATTTSGDELAFTPKRSANLWSTYRLPVGLTLGGGLQYVSDAWIGRPDTADRVIPNGRYGKLPGYTIYNLVASYDLSPKTSLRLNIDNVTDELYAASANWNGSRVLLGASRSYLLSVDFSF